MSSQDVNGDGQLSAAELIQGLRGLGVGTASDMGRSLLSALDLSGDQVVDYREFLAAAMDRRTNLTDQAIAQLFCAAPSNLSVQMYEQYGVMYSVQLVLILLV